MARRRGAVELFGGEGDGDDDWEDGTDALPDVLARRPATVQAAGRGEERRGRNLPAEWRQELFSLTARRHWLSNPRHAVARMKTALEQSGGDCDARGWNGQTVLHGCAASGFLEGCLFMLHKGADRELQNGRGWSALMIAAKRGHSAVCVALLTAAIPPHDKPAAVRRSLDQCTSNGATPLEIALTHGQPAIADILAAHGAVVPARLAALAAKAAGEVPSGGLHLAAAASSAGEVSAEATRDGASLELLIARSSADAVRAARQSQHEARQALGSALYGATAASGRVEAHAVGQGWGISRSEQGKDAAYRRKKQHDEEIVEVNGEKAPRAVHRAVAASNAQLALGGWGAMPSIKQRMGAQERKGNRPGHPYHPGGPSGEPEPPNPMLPSSRRH